ncbi:MAG: amidohydrolase [Acidobacteria bacterium]|nr:amidohydrolase [Acidobacteriota bacterium]
MKTSRREFLMAAGMAGAIAAAWQQNFQGAAASPQQEPSLPPEATQGPWRNLRAVREKKVIDFHCHIWETATQSESRLGTGLLHEEGHMVDFSEQMLASMDKHGIAVAALSPVFVGYERYFNSKWKQTPKRFVMMAGVQEIEPRPSIPQAAEILRKQFQQGARGIGEGGLPGYGDDPKSLKPVIDVVKEFDVPVLNHTGWSALQTSGNLNYSAAWRGAERFGILAAHYPDVKLVIGHIGGRFDFLDGYEMLRVAFTFDNVLVETSKSTPRIITEAVRGLGAERVIFGSDWNRPEVKAYGPKHFRDVYQHWYNLNQIALADITEDERDMILYKNAQRLLKMSN